MSEKEKVKQVYKYWISKSDGKMHKEIAYVLKSKYDYTIFDSTNKPQSDIRIDEFENNMLQRTMWQAIYLYKEDDELAKKHFKWAIKSKIKEAREQIDKCEDMLKGL